MNQAKVIVVGELNVDLIFAGSGIQPEPNREKLVEDFRLALGSSSAITAAGLAGLGLEVELVSIVGDDDFGRFCVKELENFGVGTGNVKLDATMRTGATLSLTDGRDRSLLTYLGSIASVTPELIPDSLFAGASHVHFGSYYLQAGMREHWAALFRMAKEAGLTTSFDVGWDPDEQWDRERLKQLLEWTDWFLPSEEEAMAIFECSDINELPKYLPERRGYVAVKRGSAGALMIKPDGTVIEGEPVRVSPVDTTGAGDSFNAGLIAARLNGKPEQEALTYANVCGAMSTLRIGGAGSLTIEDLKQFWQAQP
ncbi:sugar kinase [Paenibacillus pasadenensis]|uniref:carbohydrate kinase family protein n=1 Tax=Paenibacillus pasadenensis TaxID=217090 RepID=UPI00203B7937|nr:sugar kinase [Paenibacillus pasadenensis]MCM3747233.1 sugar kinase [Paenibacillus pasadenensis]